MKKYLISIICIVIVLFGGLGLYFYPKIQAEKEIKQIKQEVLLVANYLNNKEKNKKEIEEFIKKDYATGSRQELEKVIDEKLQTILALSSEQKELLQDEKLNNILVIEHLKDTDNNTYLEETKTKLSRNLQAWQELIDKEKDLSLQEDNFVKYQEIMPKNLSLQENLEKMNNYVKNIEDKQKTLQYLNNNTKTWNSDKEKIVFTKRKNYNAYQDMVKNMDLDLAYELINDQTPPVINAKDITIYKGNKINLNDKIKCVDSVDDDVKCQIDGKYDVNKIGTYKINIKAKDLLNNQSTKTIKLNVKAKPTNKKPYYIEVLRNHNVVIVYGLDSDNNYTKIVKVFVCSVGINGKTPTGTFKTSDKSSWGWLVGNVYGQYYTRIKGNILFHSVPYFKKAKNQLEWEEYNKLGTAASKGCVRLTVRDVKWIYNNCPRGTTVKIYDGSLPSGVKKPSAQKIDETNPNRGWDPTDPDKNNPWKK